MDSRRAFAAGVVGGIFMSACLALMRLASVSRLELEMILGSLLSGRSSSITWLMGLFIHLMLCGFIACGYALVFESLRRSSWWLGAVLGAFHASVAGVALEALGSLHPLLLSPGPTPPPYFLAPGFFAINYGAPTALALVIVHIVYGAVVGATYVPAGSRPLIASRIFQ